VKADAEDIYDDCMEVRLFIKMDELKQVISKKQLNMLNVSIAKEIKDVRAYYLCLTYVIGL